MTIKSYQENQMIGGLSNYRGNGLVPKGGKL